MALLERGVRFRALDRWRTMGGGFAVPNGSSDGRRPGAVHGPGGGVGPPNAVSWDSTVLTVTGYRRFTIEDAADGDGCLVTATKTFTSPVLPLRLFYPRPNIQKMSRRWLLSLKGRVESS